MGRKGEDNKKKINEMVVVGSNTEDLYFAIFPLALIEISEFTRDYRIQT